MAEFSVCRLWLVCLSLSISGNVDDDMNVRFKCKQPSSPISSFSPRNAPLRIGNKILLMSIFITKVKSLTDLS